MICGSAPIRGCEKPDAGVDELRDSSQDPCHDAGDDLWQGRHDGLNDRRQRRHNRGEQLDAGVDDHGDRGDDEVHECLDDLR